jgi:hypothetical protein
LNLAGSATKATQDDGLKARRYITILICRRTAQLRPLSFEAQDKRKTTLQKS